MSGDWSEILRVRGTVEAHLVRALLEAYEIRVALEAEPRSLPAAFPFEDAREVRVVVAADEADDLTPRRHARRARV